MGPLVGREREVARLDAFLAGLAAGPSALVIEGEPGIGKTALLEATLARAAALPVLRARCAQAESGLAYAGLADLLGRVTETVLAGLPSPQRRAVQVVLGRAEVGQDAVEPQLVGRATLAVMESLASGSPLLVAVDDVQWLDPASTRTLTFVLRRLEAALPVGLLVTRRATGGPLPLGLEDALSEGRRERLVVGPLDPDELELLVEARLGEPLPRALRRRWLRLPAATRCMRWSWWMRSAGPAASRTTWWCCRPALRCCWPSGWGGFHRRRPSRLPRWRALPPRRWR
jgi:predicted ATPase